MTGSNTLYMYYNPLTCFPIRFSYHMNIGLNTSIIFTYQKVLRMNTLRSTHFLALSLLALLVSSASAMEISPEESARAAKVTTDLYTSCRLYMAGVMQAIKEKAHEAGLFPAAVAIEAPAAPVTPEIIIIPASSSVTVTPAVLSKNIFQKALEASKNAYKEVLLPRVQAAVTFIKENPKTAAGAVFLIAGSAWIVQELYKSRKAAQKLKAAVRDIQDELASQEELLAEIIA